MKRTLGLQLAGAALVIAMAAVWELGGAALGADDLPAAAPLPGGSPMTGREPTAELRTQAVEAAGLMRPVQPRRRYQTLLRTIEVGADRATYGDFCDYGYWDGGSYAGHDDLPAGYWVYLAPNWHIFKNDQTSTTASAKKPPQLWGPEQATGAPDTWPRSGDIGTAWASKTPDGQREWLELTYDAPIRAVAVVVYETFNPGAVDRVSSYDAKGNELELWSGADPTPPGKEKGISVIPLQADFDLSRIRIGLDSQKVTGWNEIDAVGLLDVTGKIHWATSATASSSYADTTAEKEPEHILRLLVPTEEPAGAITKPQDFSRRLR